MAQEEVRTFPLLIDGKSVEEGEVREIKAPYDGKVVGKHYRAGAKQVAAALDAAEAAFRKTRALAAYERSQILERVRDGIRRRYDEIVQICSLECGKPVTFTRIEIDRAISTFDLASKYVMTEEGHTLPPDIIKYGENRTTIVQRFPLGIITAITPYNWPMNLLAHKVAPAMAVGNSICLRPASQTPLTAFILGELITEAGYPAGGFNIVPCSTDDADALVTDERVKMISFTGSTEVGWSLKEKALKKKVSLELGSNSAAVLDEGTDIEKAVPRLVTGGFHYAGQNCISVQRVLTHESIFDEVRDATVEEVNRSAKTGDPLDEDVMVGPLISSEDAERVMEWIQEAVDGGARALTGHKREGNIVHPTVLTGTKPDMKVNCEEVFGPVVTVESFGSFDEAIERVNDSKYGLHAGVYTENVHHAWQAFRELEVGGVIINDYPTFRVDNLPYGGVKESGHGREGIKYAMEEMTELKHLTFHFG